MAQRPAIFFDLGGVILSNGWDRESRVRAAEKFNLDIKDLENRHESEAAAFETRKITLETYLDRTVFYRSRTFSRDTFIAFMFDQSSELPQSRAVLAELANTGKYFLATINNEPYEINMMRIERFHLRQEFDAFFSSCFVGIRKPDVGIYRLALEVAQRPPAECLFIDDREENLEGARKAGLRIIHFQSAEQLRVDLLSNGVAFSKR
jgi:putative hydrolase of the HAD superfamily